MGRYKNAYIFAPKKEKRGGWGCFVTLALLLLSAAVAALIFNGAANQRVSLLSEKVSVMSLDKAYEGFTVLHISDLHASPAGSDLTLWRDLLYAKTFHAVVLTGDMVGSGGEYEPLLSLIHALRQANATAPIYFIDGDDDPAAINATPRGTPEVMADWVLAAQKAGAIYLDAPVSQQAGKKQVWFVPEKLYDVDAAGSLGSLTLQKESMEAQGQQYDSAGGATYRAIAYRMDAMQRTVDAQKLMAAGDLQIAVAHAPLDADYIRRSIEWADESKPLNYKAINLVLAGHYCGGQWRLPGVGAVYVPDLGWFPPDEKLVGLQRINSINQHISGGVGASEYYPIKWRLFNTPSVTLVKFTGSLQ